MAAEADILVGFGQRVRQLRQARALSQEELAFRTDLDRTYVSGIERGKRNVGLRNVDVLARALGVTLAELFEGLG